MSSGPHHQDSGEAKIRESTAGVSRKPSSDGKACGCSSQVDPIIRTAVRLK